MLTATGTGYSRWNGLSVARWKPDPTEDRWGQFLFLRDTTTGEWWSATAEPRRIEGEKTKAIFSDERAEFHKTIGDLTSTVECIVATEHDAEGRRLTLLNMGTEDRFIEVTSYMEPVLTNEDDDNAHPVFQRMFVRTEIGRRGDVIRAWRNKRAPNEPDMVIAHLAADNAGSARPTEFETDRRKFLGRGRTLAEAAAFDPGATLSGTDGFTLDPILSLRRVVRVPAGKKVSVIFWTIAAPRREELDQAIERYRHPDAFQTELTQAWTRTQVQMRHLGVSSQDAAAFQHLARYLIYPDMQLRADQATIHAGMQQQSALWPSSVSGDFPIFTLRINDDNDMPVAKEAMSAQEYLRSRGVITDLVIFNERAASYAQEMQQALEHLSESSRRLSQQEGQRQHVFSLRRDIMDDAGSEGLIAASRVVLHARNGKISDQAQPYGDDLCAAEGSGDRGRSSSAAERRDLPGSGSDRGTGGSRFLERLWRFHQGRQRIRRAPAWRPVDAAAVDQHHLQRQVRLPHRGRRFRLHLGQELPRLPADRLDQRHGHQPARRGVLRRRSG